MRSRGRKFALRPIGRVRGGAIQLHARWVNGLKGIEGFSHLVVLCWLDRAGAPELVIHPKGIEELPRVGFLATRTPHRPNPLGVTVVRLLGRRGARLRVHGLDVWEDTPVLDVKPYTPKESIKAFSIPAWLRRLNKHLIPSEFP